MSHMRHHHSEETRRARSLRLRKIIGQLNGIERMVMNDVDCSEILNQVVSVRRALKSFAEVIIEQHTEHCIMGVSDPKQSKARMNDLLKVFKRYVE